MKRYLILFFAVFLAGLAFLWSWGLSHRMDFLSRDYAIWTGKTALMEGQTSPWTAFLGDSMVLNDVVPGDLGGRIVNLGLNGGTAIEGYFLVRRALSQKVPPQAVLFSYSANHFVHPDFYWENSVKFGVVGPKEADEVLGWILKTRDGELINHPGFGDLDQRLYSFLVSRGFPTYFFPSFSAEPWGKRAGPNGEAFRKTLGDGGHYYFPFAPGSKALSPDTKLKGFAPDPVVDHYFCAMIALLKERGIPAYFVPMPVNEISERILGPVVRPAYDAYLDRIAREEGWLKVISSRPWTYPWKLFSDHSHLNARGTSKFNRELSKALDRAKVPGGPYEVARSRR